MTGLLSREPSKGPRPRGDQEANQERAEAARPVRRLLADRVGPSRALRGQERQGRWWSASARWRRLPSAWSSSATWPRGAPRARPRPWSTCSRSPGRSSRPRAARRRPTTSRASRPRRSAWKGALAALDGHFKSARGPLADEAALVRGGLLLDLGRADEAQAIYEKLLAGRLDARLRFLAHEGLGYALRTKGQARGGAGHVREAGDRRGEPGRLLQGSGPLPRSAAGRAARQPGRGHADLSRGAGQEPDHLVARRDLEPTRAARAEVTRRVRFGLAALATAFAAAAGCASATVRRLDDSGAPAHRAGILQIVLADDAARSRPVRAVARGVRVGASWRRAAW